MRHFLKTYFFELLDLLYDAALLPERWPAFFHRMSKAFADARGVLHLWDRLSATTGSISFGTAPEYLASFAAHYASCNPYPAPCLAELKLGEVTQASAIVDEPTLVKIEFYNDWMRPQGISPHRIGAVLQRDTRYMALLGIAPNARALHKDMAGYVRRLRLLTPHLSRAIEMNRLAARAGFAERALDEALDALPAAAFLVEGAGRVLLANALAQRLLREERAVGMDARGRLQAGRTHDGRALDAAMAAAAAPLPQPPLPVPLTSKSAGRKFLARILPTRGTRAAPACSEPTLDFYRPRTMLVIVTSDDKGRIIPVESVMAAFRVSAAEARLVSACAAA